MRFLVVELERPIQDIPSRHVSRADIIRSVRTGHFTFAPTPVGQCAPGYNCRVGTKARAVSQLSIRGQRDPLRVIAQTGKVQARQ